MAYADLDEIEGFVRDSCLAMKKSINSSKEVNGDPVPEETWIRPVLCHRLPDFEPEMKKPRHVQQAKPEGQELKAVDIIRAFCHPRVIHTVSEILQEEFPKIN